MPVKHKNKRRGSHKDHNTRMGVRCPTCGNDDMEGVVFDDPEGSADIVACLRCGTRYNLLTGEFERSF